MTLGADYSYARPGGAALKAAGVQAVGRYLATDSRGITAGEYADLTAHGIGLWLVYEGATQGMLGGFAQGVHDAQVAEQQIAAVGLPAGSTLYWAADYDIAPGSSSVAPTEAYIDGWNTIIPAGRRGGYGGLWFLKYVHDKGKVERLWECGSTSFRHGVDPASVPLTFQQTTLAPPVPGTDHNYIIDPAFASTGAAAPVWKEKDMLYIYSANRGGGVVGPTGFYPCSGEEATVALGTYGSPVGAPAGTFSDRQWDVARQTAVNIGDQFAAAVAGKLANLDASAIAKAVVAALPTGPTAAAPDTNAIAAAVEAAVSAQLAGLPAAVVKAEGAALSKS